MSYLVLARKFRPQLFSSIVGQQHVTKAIANALVRDRVPHALLFTGPRGVGKTTSARVLSRALNCVGRDLAKAAEANDVDKRLSLVEPCGECVNCTEISKSSSLAVWEIDGASNNSVDNVRELIDSLRSLPPPGSKYKIYVIDEVHMLSTAAFNALLKSLEEPPPNTIFIFATTDPQKIPETVISRCQRYDFHRLKSSIIVGALRDICAAEKVEVDEEVLEFVAHRADGGLRDAQSMFDRVLAYGEKKIGLEQVLPLFGAVDRSFFFKLSEKVFAKETAACFELLQESFSGGLDLKSFVTEFVTHWRNLLLVKLSGGKSGILQSLELPKEDAAKFKAQLESASDYDLQRLFEIAESLGDKALRSAFPRYVIEAGVARMATLSSLKPLGEILSQLQSGNIAIPEAVSASPKTMQKKVKAVESRTEESKCKLKAQKENPVSKAVAVENEDSGNGSSLSVSDVLGFNPSWEVFLKELKSKGELTLEAFLRRVNPVEFRSGVLLIEASSFDIDSLVEKEQKKKLLDCLVSYSGVENWKFSTREAKKSASNSSKRLAGSMAAKEKQQEDDENARIKKEATQAPELKTLLSAFDGSKVEKIKIIKP